MKGLLVVDVTRVEVISGRTVHLWFSDGSERKVDLTPFLWGPAFEQLAEDHHAFNQVFIDSSIGTIAWPNGADIDPDVLHGDFEPAEPPRP
jgi:hypothetical protein